MLSLPHDKVADPERKRRFLQEARAASTLNHPNIVTLHDIAADAGIDYLVMEYVPGKSLDQLIPSKGLALMEAVSYAMQIASALAAAHAAGIAHRDIKPANVMVTAESQVKILDFGLAKLVERAPDPEGETETQEAALTEAGRWWAPSRTCRRNRRQGARSIIAPIFFRSVWCFTKCWRARGRFGASRKSRR